MATGHEGPVRPSSVQRALDEDVELMGGERVAGERERGRCRSGISRGKKLNGELLWVPIGPGSQSWQILLTDHRNS